MPAHSILRCEHPSDTRASVSILAILPGAWLLLRELHRDEQAPDGHGSLKCRDCGVRWLVVEQERRAA